MNMYFDETFEAKKENIIIKIIIKFLIFGIFFSRCHQQPIPHKCREQRS